MSASAVMNCGCSTTRSMFGKREILSVSPCPAHALELQKELEALREAMFNLIKTNNNAKEETGESRTD